MGLVQLLLVRYGGGGGHLVGVVQQDPEVAQPAHAGLRAHRRQADWQALGGSATDADGRCKDLPALPEGT
ncbi:hypothetical protein ACWCQV_42995, partial [Streptomyces eurythermus]